ncbi:MAG: PorV/PorQ family protein [Candidatus Marinimicrobia bacterium]|nr:PorV/PorQ family protein [Candidatus Neomarinimicrobiota bacterium]
MKKILIIFVVLVCNLWASSSVGSATGQFLEVNLNVRNMGMGNAATSMVMGSAANYVNPAGAVDFLGSNQFDLYTSTVKWPADIQFGAISVAYKVRSLGVFSLSALYVNYGDEVRTTPDAPFGDGYFSIGGSSLALSFSRYITDKFSFGFTVKNVSEDYDGSGYSQFAFDIGTLFRTGYKNINIGMSILNFSKEAQFSGKFLDYSDPVKFSLGEKSEYGNWPLPMTFRTGISMEVFSNDIIKSKIAADMIHPNNNDEVYGIGAEIIYNEYIILRSGYQIGSDIQGLCLGGGLRLFNNIGVDYALNMMKYFGPRHRFAFNLKF